MSINFTIEHSDFKLKERLKIKKWITAVISEKKKRVGDISYLFCDDDHLLEVNISYLNHDTLTDIITFDYVEGDVISGDILISVDRVRENAQIFNVPFEQELRRVIIHGILHLLGNPDKSPSEAAKMRKKEEEALSLWED